MNAIIDAALSRSRTVLLLMTLVIVAGLYSYLAIPRESSPDVTLPFVMIDIHHEGISPEDAERLLVKPVETEVQSIVGIKEMTSVARDSGASLMLEFHTGTDINQALADVRNRVDIAKSELPEDADEPVVEEINVSLFPVVVVTISGNIPERTLLYIAKDLQDNLEALPNVLEAGLRGVREEVLEVNINTSKLESYNISPQELIEIVQRNNQVVAAGTLDTGQGSFAVKVPGLFEDARDVLELPILTQGDAVVTLSDVASIRRTFKDRSSFARLNGQPAVGLEIKKRIGTNVIETVNQVKALINEHQKRWPSGVRAYFTQDQSLEVIDQVSQLQNNVISAVILVVVVIVVALGARSAGLVGLAIPTSFLFGILVIFSLGMTLNQVVLFGLVLAVGMLVDGAIVVTEYADRKMSEGIERVKAFAMAAKRMSWPIIASVATTLAAFLPLLFWPGVMGEFMGFLPVTLIATLVGSLISALIFLPTLGGLIGRSEARKPDTLTALAATDESDLRDLPGFTGRYARFLSNIIRHPLEILGVAMLLLVGTWGWYATHGNGVEFFPSGDSGLVNLEVRGRGNLSTEEKDALVREVEDIVRSVGGVRTMYTTTGAAGNQGPVGDRAAEDRIGRISMELADWRTRPRSDVIIREIRERTSNLAGIIVVPSQNDFGPPQGKDVQIQFSSPYPELIEPAMARVRAHMETDVEGLMDIDDSRPLPGIQWEIDVDRSMAQRFNADVVTVGGMVQLVTNGIKVGEYRPDDADEEIDIRVRFPEEERSIDMLDQLVVQTSEGPIPISNFVTRTAKPQVKTIERLDGSRILTLMANVAPGYLTDTKVREIQSFIQKSEIDPRVQVTFRGQTEEQDEAQAFLGNAFIVALFLMAIILVTQFNSFYHAFLVLSAVVMSTIGVMAGLIITGRTFVIVMTGIGIIALAGIVVNNNIVLIDTFARLRKAGLEPMAAIVRTGAQRLRPVMLTTITTIVGLMPMFLQLNIDFVNRQVGAGAPTAEFWVDLATAIVFGLSFATVLTLVVTPCLLAAPYVVKPWFKAKLAKLPSLPKGKKRADNPAE